LLKLDFPLLGIQEWKYYILWNNYFYNNWLKKIKESFFVWEWWIYMWKIKKWDVIIIDANIYWYENNEDKLISIESDKYIKNKINFNWKLKTINTYWNYYKITCKNNIILLSNEDKKYDLWFKYNKVVDKKVSKEIVIKNLQKNIKTCDNFNKLFWIEKETNEKIKIEKVEEKKKSILEKILEFFRLIFKKIFW
jgi:hypothetical protein